MVRTNLQEFVGDVHVLSNLQVGSNLFANDLAANVLTVDGSIGSTFFIGDGGLLSNIATTLNDIVANPGGNTVSNTLVFESGADVTSNTAIATLSNVGISISNTEPTGEFQFAVGSNIFVNTHASNVLTVVGAIGSDLFIGDGGLLSNIATTIDQIIDQGNTVSNTLIFESGIDATSNTGIVTKKDVGISVSNTEPTGEFQFGVGSNLLVNVYSSNVLAIEGNVSAEKMTLGTITVTSAYGLNHVTAQGSVTGDTISLTNATTGLAVTSNATVGGNVTAETVITSANVEVGDRLKFASNVFVDDLRVADLAANLVTYDKTTGELMDSGGLFANKLAVVSVQPPSALSANVTTVAKHGTYTVTTSSLATYSNAWNAFDGDSAVEWLGSTTSDHVYNGGGYTYSGTSNLFAGNYIQPGVSSAGEWLAIEFPYKTTLRHMKLTPPTTYQQYPASANVYATNDSLTWTELTNWSGVNPVTSSNVQTVVVNATESFKKYAMVVTKTNGSDTNTALAEWKLFTESFSIDGGQISMAQQPVTGGETTMEQSGPHSRLPKAMPLKKYPEIIFEEGKFDSNDSTNTYVQAGYTVTASSQQNDNKNAAKLYEDNFPVTGQTNTWQTLNNTYDSNNGDATSDYALGGRDGSYTTLELPHKIKLSYIQIQTRNSDNFVAPIHPKQIYLYGSNDGSSWTQVGSHLFTSIPISPVWQKIDINSTTPYNYFALQVTSVLENESRVSICQLRYYGYEELATQGDTSVDTTFTSIMNTPQTTGAQVYTDAKLSSDFTNRVTGPTPTGTATSYDQTGKYWELTGALESNVTLEANTFLEGDQPHAVSVWFNSSNLEANVSNTCVFSVSDQEKLDSVNLDLQSNTWHNLTYAYQGEGGSRVTYLDGRKVAEDQAEDTFGEYPPFAMTGYSQGGYVASFSSAHDSVPWHMWGYDETSGVDEYGWTTPFVNGGGGVAVFEVTSGDVRDGGGGIPNLSGTYQGEYAKLELPYKLVLSYIMIRARGNQSVLAPRDFKMFGSNDDVNWVEILSETGATPSQSADTSFYSADVQDRGYKYLALVINKIQPNNSHGQLSLRTLKLYGHRENDLVRLPDPTNVLKYPHIAMTGPAQRGYVATGSTYSHFPASGDPDALWRSFDGITGDNTKVWKTYEMYTTAGVYSPGTYGRTASSITDTSSTQHSGEYLVLETPHKIKLSSWEVRAEYAPRRIVDYAILGSDTNSSSANKTGWTLLTSGTFAAQTDVTATVSSPTTAFKYHAIVVKSVTNNADSRRSQVHEMKLYGTGVDSVPIQIGGGNIDKVANFRVYDTFVGEDQALEIWDAQKDEFERVKSSMTLQKGRLGIGTTEPEGRLAVADEPHNLEEFPPKPLSDSLITHIEGHGIFKVYASVSRTGTNGAVNLFDKKPVADGGSFWLVGNGAGYNTSSGAYEGESGTIYRLGSETSTGQYVTLEMPYPIKLEKYSVGPRSGSNYQTPKDWELWGSNDGSSWTKLHNVIGNAEYVVSVTYDAPQTNYYRHFGFVVTRTIMTGAPSGYDYLSVGELKLFGTREQGQSVLHDGQLTLTKNLDVPRIGPALDADDTPRRDRLVVEYNTSTNPTFEGAVRDTSGRGNDGFMKGLAIYDANEKALVFDGASGATSSVIEVGEITNYNTNWVHSVSVWLNMHSPANYETVYSFGDPAAAARNNIAIHIANTQFLAESTGGSSTNYWNITGGAWKVGIWEHFVFVRDGSLAGVEGFKIYQNGVELASTGGTNASTAIIIPRTSTFRIGQRITSVNDQPYDGDLSQFKLYDTALTAEEVKTLYDMGRCDEGHHVVNFSKTRVGIGLGDGEAPRGALDVRGDIYGGCPVFFHATRTTHAEPTSSSGFDPLIWESTRNNKGGGYSTTTGKFTAPIAGYYEFTYGGMTLDVNDRLEMIPKLNNVRYAGPLIFISPDSAQQHRYGTATAIVEMQVGDTWHIEMPANGSAGMYGTGLNYNMFTGKFLSY
jgi:hypothetical protein